MRLRLITEHLKVRIRLIRLTRLIIRRLRLITEHLKGRLWGYGGKARVRVVLFTPPPSLCGFYLPDYAHGAITIHNNRYDSDLVQFHGIFSSSSDQSHLVRV